MTNTEKELANLSTDLEKQLALALKILLFACRDGAVLPRDDAHKRAREGLATAGFKEFKE